jgi:hypothetical protein
MKGIAGWVVLNVEETGRLKHVDSHEMRVVVLIDYSNSSLPVPANHNSNQSMLTASIAAEECRMTLFVIVDQATVKAEFHLFGCELSNVFLASQRNVFMTVRLFKVRTREVFFLAIQEQLIQCNYAEKVRFLLDQSDSSDTDKSVKTFAERNNDLLFLVSHSSDQAQLLQCFALALLTR